MQLDPLPPSARSPATSPSRPPPHGRSTLAVFAVVLASLFFIPLAPLFGLVLGIIALATHRSRTLSIVAISLGAVFTLVTIVWAVIAASAFLKYVRRAKALEATANLEKLARSAADLSPAARAQLATADWTPAGRACGRANDQFPGEPGAWSSGPWPVLGFAIAEPHYFQYRLSRAGDDLIVEARADLDCDEQYSLYARKVSAAGVGAVTIEGGLE
jgi:hypothetical protein